MRVPLIAQIDANSSETRPFPALDGVGRIPFSEKDGSPLTIKADKVECCDFLSTGKSEINFWLDGIPAGSWDITVTDQRLVVYSRFSKGLIGKPKEKAGKASAGHMYYGSISNLSVFLDGNVPVLLICCYRKDGTRTAFTIKSTNLDSMKKLAAELHDHIDRWIISQGRKLDESDGDEKLIAVLKKWNEFNENLWNGNKEYSVFVPCQSWDQVPDSRVF